MTHCIYITKWIEVNDVGIGLQIILTFNCKELQQLWCTNDKDFMHLNCALMHLLIFSDNFFIIKNIYYSLVN